jgi:glycosyltransferase involved in cell wall biosynthesis
MLDISLITLGDPARQTGGYLYHRRLAERAGAYGARVDFISVREAAFPVALLSAGRALRSLPKSTDAVLLDSIAASLVAPWLGVTPPRQPLVAILHQPPGGIDHGPVRSALQASLDSFAYRRAACLIAASESLADDLAERGFPKEFVRVVPPGRDVSARSQSPGDLRKGRGIALLCVGNWVERKGLLPLLEAFSRLPPNLATLHLAGDTKTECAYGRRVHARLSRPDLSDRVVVHGVVPPARVAALYAGADVFVLASFTEPYGTVYGEAMAAGLPVVGWRAGNLPNLAHHEQHGLLVAPGDVAGLAHALGRLATEEALRVRLGTGAQRRAQGFPTWVESVAEVISTVREAVERGRSGGGRKSLL